MAPQLRVDPLPGGPAIPAGGALDLSTLKGAPKAIADAAFIEALKASQLVCQCGERLRDDGRLLFVRRNNTIPSPQGGLPGLAAVVVHALDCEVYRSIVGDLTMTLVAIRRVTEIQWLDELVTEEE